MTTRDQQRIETRQRLLVAARNLFEVQGFEKTHLRDIAVAAGVATGTIFVHFVDKKDLLHATLFEDLDTALDFAFSSGPTDFEPWLEHIANTFFNYYMARPQLSRVLLRESLVAEPPWSQRFANQFARVHTEVVARFERARTQGEVCGDAALFGVAFISFYTFALLAWVQGAHSSPHELLSRLIAQQLSGVRS